MNLSDGPPCLEGPILVRPVGRDNVRETMVGGFDIEAGPPGTRAYLVRRAISSLIRVSARVGTTSQTTCSTTSRDKAITPAT